MADMKIYQEVELSLTENLIPTVIHVKQFDHKARKVRCLLYTSSVEYTIPEGAIVSCAGTRPDGHLFQYSSETAPELVSIEDNAVMFTITDFMTAVFGRWKLWLTAFSSALLPRMGILASAPMTGLDICRVLCPVPSISCTTPL